MNYNTGKADVFGPSLKAYQALSIPLRYLHNHYQYHTIWRRKQDTVSLSSLQAGCPLGLFNYVYHFIRLKTHTVHTEGILHYRLDLHAAAVKPITNMQAINVFFYLHTVLRTIRLIQYNSWLMFWKH